MSSLRRSWFDTAQICINGHIVNQQVLSVPDLNQRFCDHCGAATITACPICRTPVRGYCAVPGIVPPSDGTAPSYCPGCGSPYPWTEQRILEAQELADELDQLSLDERELLKKSIDDLLADGPRTQLASLRFKTLVAKAGADAAASFKEILVSVVSEAVRRVIWGA
jgi:hypothetical protein